MIAVLQPVALVTTLREVEEAPTTGAVLAKKPLKLMLKLSLLILSQHPLTLTPLKLKETPLPQLLPKLKLKTTRPRKRSPAPSKNIESLKRRSLLKLNSLNLA